MANYPYLYAGTTGTTATVGTYPQRPMRREYVGGVDYEIMRREQQMLRAHQDAMAQMLMKDFNPYRSRPKKTKEDKTPMQRVSDWVDKVRAATRED